MCNICQAFAGGDFLQCLHFTLRQAGVGRLVDGVRQALGQHLRHLLREVFAPAGHGAHGFDQGQGIARFVGIALGPRFDAAQGVLVLGVHRDHQHPNVRVAFAHAGQHLQAIAPRHVNIQQQHLARGAAQQLAQLGVVTRLTGHANIDRLGQRIANAAAQHSVVVTQYNVDQAHLLGSLNRPMVAKR